MQHSREPERLASGEQRRRGGRKEYMVLKLTRKQYTDLFGPTTGDKVRLGDTDLMIQIEKDLITPGDECVFGGGKTIRDGLAQASGVTNSNGALDFLITNAIILDPVLGIVKADIGIKDGKIAGVGKAGNPYTMDKVNSNMVVSACTEATAGEHTICTPGHFDTHIHMISPQQYLDGISNGICNMIGGGTGPADGTNATTCTPGVYNMSRMLESVEDIPVNWGFLGKGNDSHPSLATQMEQIEAGACGLKDHEDWGTTASVLDASLRACDATDTQLAIHTDSINECAYVEDSINAIDGRTLHTYHTEGAGGGHAPDIKKMKGKLPQETEDNDNFRARRYIAKTTINCAITHGVSDYLGSLEVGKYADIVMYPTSFFPAKPKMVFKGGFIAWSIMGDPNASLPTPEPVYYRPMFGALGKAVHKTSYTFMSKRAIELGVPQKLGLEKVVLPVKNCRYISKKDMMWNDATPKIDIDPETYEVKLDGKIATVDPANELTLAQRYFMG